MNDKNGSNGKNGAAGPVEIRPTPDGQPSYPHEFIDAVASDALNTLFHWLLDNGAPEAASNIAGSVEILFRYAYEARTTGKVFASDDRQMGNSLATLTTAIAELGGVFRGAEGGESLPREPARWERPAA